MKTKEEQKQIKDDELKQVTGGTSGDTYKFAQENPENTCDNAQDSKGY